MQLKNMRWLCWSTGLNFWVLGRSSGQQQLSHLNYSTYLLARNTEKVALFGNINPGIWFRDLLFSEMQKEKGRRWLAASTQYAGRELRWELLTPCTMFIASHKGSFKHALRTARQTPQMLPASSCYLKRDDTANTCGLGEEQHLFSPIRSIVLLWNKAWQQNMNWLSCRMRSGKKLIISEQVIK